MHADSYPNTSNTTTTGVSTPPSAMSPQKPNSKERRKSYSKNATENLTKPAKSAGYGDRKSSMLYWKMPGETEAGAAGEQPRQGITRSGSSRRCATGWGSETHAPVPLQNHRIDRPAMPKKTPPEGRLNATCKMRWTPVPAEPRHRPR